MANTASGFSVVGMSDVLRTAGAAFLLTRRSKWWKALGGLWLLGEIYSLSKREGALHPGPDNVGAALAMNVPASTATTPAPIPVTGLPSLDALLPFTGKPAPAPSQAGDGLAVPAFAGFLGYAL